MQSQNVKGANVSLLLSLLVGLPLTNAMYNSLEHLHQVTSQSDLVTSCMTAVYEIPPRAAIYLDNTVKHSHGHRMHTPTAMRRSTQPSTHCCTGAPSLFCHPLIRQFR